MILNLPSYNGKRQFRFDRAVSDQRSPQGLLNASRYYCTVLLKADVTLFNSRSILYHVIMYHPIK